MLAWIRQTRHRAYLRAQFGVLLDEDPTLPPATQTILRQSIAADPVLKAEFERLERALGQLRQLPTAPVPRGFDRELALEIDFLHKPVRERYADLLDGSLAGDEAGIVRQQIDADAELRHEFAAVERTVVLLRALPAVPVPAGFQFDLARRLDAIAPRRPVPTPALSWMPRLAGAGMAAALLLMVGYGSVMISRHSERLGEMTGGAVLSIAAAPQFRDSAERGAMHTAALPETERQRFAEAVAADLRQARAARAAQAQQALAAQQAPPAVPATSAAGPLVTVRAPMARPTAPAARRSAPRSRPTAAAVRSTPRARRSAPRSTAPTPSSGPRSTPAAPVGPVAPTTPAPTVVLVAGPGVPEVRSTPRPGRPAGMTLAGYEIPDPAALNTAEPAAPVMEFGVQSRFGN